MKRAVYVATTLVLVAGCTNGSPPEQRASAEPGACPLLDGRTYRTRVKGDCGPGAGDSTCTWKISFASAEGGHSRYRWQYSDVLEKNTVTCDDRNQVTGEGGLGRRGSYDDRGDVLLWEGKEYVAVDRDRTR